MVLAQNKPEDNGIENSDVSTHNHSYMSFDRDVKMYIKEKTESPTNVARNLNFNMQKIYGTYFIP